jgi:hypothetical protein
MQASLGSWKVSTRQQRLLGLLRPTGKCWRIWWTGTTSFDGAVFCQRLKTVAASGSTTKGTNNQALVESWIRQATNRLESSIVAGRCIRRRLVDLGHRKAHFDAGGSRASGDREADCSKDRGMNVSIAARESVTNFTLAQRSFYQPADVCSIDQEKGGCSRT